MAARRSCLSRPDQAAGTKRSTLIRCAVFFIPGRLPGEPRGDTGSPLRHRTSCRDGSPFPGNPRTAVEDIRKLLAADAKLARRFRHREPRRLRVIVAHGQAGIKGKGHRKVRFSLVAVNDAEIPGIVTTGAKDDRAVARQPFEQAFRVRVAKTENHGTCVTCR